MVGRLNLQDVPDLLDMKKRSERVLDSPDSGLPPSPCPSNWLVTPAVSEKSVEQDLSGQTGQGPLFSWADVLPSMIWAKQLLTLISGLFSTNILSGGKAPFKAIDESKQNPELRILMRSSPPSLTLTCTPRLCPLSFGEGVELDPLPPKEIRYTSSVKYDSEKHFIDNVYMPVGLGVSSCSQTVICIPNCTWRNYRAEVHFEPRNKPHRFMSTTIVYPKHTKTVYTTTLDYNCKKCMRRFLSSVELESAEHLGNEGFMDEY